MSKSFLYDRKGLLMFYNTLNILFSERMGRMKKQPLPRVLFSCAGTTDPIRGEHDGPLLHIMRHYRPEKVLIFLTQEIHEKWQEIDCKNKMMAYLREKLDGYAPEIVVFSSDIADPSDLDALDRDMEKAFREAPYRQSTNGADDEKKTSSYIGRVFCKKR